MWISLQGVKLSLFNTAIVKDNKTQANFLLLQPHVEIFVSTNNSTIIKAVIVFAEGIFKGETHVVHPPASKLSSQITVPIFIAKDIPIDIHIKVRYNFLLHLGVDTHQY